MRALFLKAKFRGLRGLTVAAILLLPVGLDAEPGPPQSQSVAPAKRSGGTRLMLVGVGNLGQVTPMLYRGGQPKPVGFAGLAKMGVDIVVDARLSGKDTERKRVEKNGMKYVSIPWHCLWPKDEVFARFLAVLRQNPGKKVFVHCRYGDDRTGMMIAAYRMSVEGWTAKEALKEMNQFGFHHFACHSLIEYERDFPKHLRSNPVFSESHPGGKPGSPIR